MGWRRLSVCLAFCCASLAYGQSQAAAAQSEEKPSVSQASIQEQNDAFVQKILKQIAGRETEPAEKVFKNVQWLKTTPANRFLLIMNRGYSRALGVSCTHCHDENDFSSDSKRPKKAAREMQVMHRNINEQLSKMQSLDPANPQHVINCSTCHRGAINPMAADNK